MGIGLACIVWVGYTLETNVRTTDHDKSSTASYNTDGAWFGVPYAIIDRESFGDPVLSIMDVSLFHPSLLYQGNVLQGDMGWGWRCRWRWIHRLVGQGSNKDDDHRRWQRRLANNLPRPFLRVPFPTGAFWTNLVVHPRTEKAYLPILGYSNPIITYPYSYQWSAIGKLQALYLAGRRVVKSKMIQDVFAPDITLGSVESVSTRHVVRFDSLSVTLRFYEGDSIQSNYW